MTSSVERLRQSGTVRPWLRVYSGNARGRAFWEKLGWSATAERTRGSFPPHAELLTYELRWSPRPPRAPISPGTS